MFISNTSIKRPVFATVLMLGLLTLGIFSYRRLAIDMMPDVELPILTVITEYPGASAETVEREVTKRIEEAVNPISGVKHIYSTSRESFSQVIVEFELQVKVNEASQEVRAKINGIRNELPEQMKEPVIQKMEIGAMPIVSLAVRSSTITPRDLTTMTDRKIKRRLENISGVGKVRLVGASKREVNVLVDPARIQALGMGVDEVVGGIAAENVNTPLGRLNRQGTETPLRISGKPALVGGFESMVIGHRGDHPVALGEVATVVDGVEEQRSLALVNGVPAVAIDILKQSKTNRVGVADAVKKEVDRLGSELPAGTEIIVIRDASKMIRESVDDVQQTLIIGGFLTILIVFCFLNSWRSTVITGLTLPISVISSFIVMYFLGMTLNVMTLMALSLAIGLLIDDAIVVRENIVRHLEHGQDHFTAAREGTSEIGLAVLATSMSIIAVFVPVAFMKGIIGRFFFQFGMTVAFAVLVSLFVSFTLDPMLSSRWFDPDVERKGKRHLVARILDHFNGWFDRTADQYKRVIGWSLDHRKAVVLIAGAAFAGGLGLFAIVESEFLPTFDHGELMVRFKTAPDASIEETKGRLGEVLKVLGTYKEIDHTYAAIAPAEGDTVRNAMVYAHLRDKRERTRSQQQLMPDIRARLARIPGIVLSVEEDPDNMQKPLQLLVRGEEIPKLKEYAAAIKRKMYAIAGVADLEATLEQDLPEYRLVVDRDRARRAGIGTDALVRTIGSLVGGQVVSTYEDESGEAVDVRVRLPRELRRDIRQVSDLRIAVSGEDGTVLIPIADLVKVERTISPSEISRQDLSRQVVISGNLDRLPLGTAANRSLQAAATVPMAPGYSVRMAGDTEIMVESFGYMGEALILAIIFVYLILAAQFESFVDPLAIMLSLPLSIVGMAGMLVLTHDTVNIMSLIGLILLMGLVTKNAILLVDYAKVLRRQGMERREAIIIAGRTRLRPIMMTTLAMIFGMVPLALAIGQGAEMRAPMARAVIGGLITSTLLTLIVVPVVYTLLDDVAMRLRRRRQRSATLGETAAETAEPRRLVPAARTGTAAARAGVVVVLTFVLLMPATGLAAEPPLTLDRAIAIAQEKNRDLQKAREYRRWVQGKYLEERAAALPHLTMSGGAMKTWDSSYEVIFGNLYPPGQRTYSADVSITQVLYAWGKVGAAIRAAKEGVASAEDQLEIYRQAAVRDVTAAHTDVLLAKEIQSIAGETLAQRERHLAEAKRRNALGVATDYDVLSATVAVQNARPDVIHAGNLVRTAYERLRLILAEPELEGEVAGSLEVAPSDPPPYEEVAAEARRRRPDLKELEHRLAVYRQLVKIASADDKPRLDFRGGFGWKDLAAGPLDGRGRNWNGGIFLAFPFFDGMATRGRLIQAKSDLERQRIDSERANDNVTLEARTTVDAVREAAEIVRALSGTLDQAKRLLEMAEQGYSLGVKTQIEVQDAELNLRAAEGNLARARHDLRVARVNLDWVRGAL
ncbi:MAG TPA: efflux RND transporter permease subunit [Thermoanaerobaculia bacterium]|nr:efflux RND transporter permease subunit [Thermoanaerobaculia bacterium]